MDSAKTWKVAIYARLSKEDDAFGISESIMGQYNIIRDWAKQRDDVVIVAQYADDGCSGATFERPGFKQMIDDAQRGLFDTIAVKDLSRFGRSYLDCGSWIERDLPRMGVRLFSVADDFDSMQRWDYNMALLLPMKNLMNEMQVITTSEKVRASLAAKRSRGECVANFAPYGYMKDPADRHRLAVDESAAQVVRMVFSMYLDGKSASGIARYLNDSDIPSPAAHKREMGLRYTTGFATDAEPSWHAKTILRMLRDETYTGALVQGKTRRPNWRFREGLPVPLGQWQRTSGSHEPIVSEAEFERAAVMLAEMENAAESHHVKAQAALRVRCGDCGAPMRRVVTRASGRSYAYYMCSAHRRDVRQCSTHSIREEALFAQVSCLESSGLADSASNDVEGLRGGSRSRETRYAVRADGSVVVA